jgi:UDP-glucose 4-epimerase
LTLHTVDINDPEAIAFVKRGGYEAVYHLAAQIDVRRSVLDPAFDAEVNIIGSIRLLEACLCAGTRKFIFASSGGAGYGDQTEYPASEEHSLRPLSPYGVAKVAVEHYLYYYWKTKGLPYISLRFANVYGERQNPHGEAGVVAIFADKMLAGQNPTIYGDGTQTRDFVHVSDVVAACMAALQYNGVGAFNVGTGIETNINQVFGHINTALSGAFTPQYAAAKEGELLRSVIAIYKIAAAMQWQPKVNIADGIARTIAWFKANHVPKATKQ